MIAMMPGAARRRRSEHSIPARRLRSGRVLPARLRLPAGRVFSAVSIALVLTACDAGDGNAPPAEPATLPAATGEVATVSFDSATVIFVSGADTVRMPVEIADRADRRAFGLMDRDELDPAAGMIFLYDQIQHEDTGFWMYRTRIPLDIAYFDGAGRILAIRQMMPCTTLDAAQCPGYSAGVPFFGAIEANRGYFTRNGIGVGDRIVLPGRIGR